MKKILFPTDFSSTAENAFQYAINIASSYDAEIIVLHIAESKMKEEYLREDNFYKNQEIKMREIIKNHQINDLKISFQIDRGNLLDVVHNTISDKNIDMIVMGTNGASGIGKKIWGTNAVDVMESVHIPVISIAHQAEYKGIKKIGITTIFKDSDKKIIEEVLKIAQYFNAKVNIVHIMEYGGNMDKKELFVNEKINEWKLLFNNENLEFIIKKSEDIKKEIIQTIKEDEIDILVTAKKNLSFIDSLFYPSITSSLISSGKVAMMVVNEE